MSKIKRQRINRAKIPPAPISFQNNSASQFINTNTLHMKNKKFQPKLRSLLDEANNIKTHPLTTMTSQAAATSKSTKNAHKQPLVVDHMAS